MSDSRLSYLAAGWRIWAVFRPDEITGFLRTVRSGDYGGLQTKSAVRVAHV